MAKELAIKVKFSSDGQEKVIKNISELEKEIESLSEEIKTLDFGSKEYEEAASNLSKLRAGLRDVDREIEGLDTEQRLSALAGATELISGSFLIAASAARTFGASAESIEEIEELERQALEAVNIALGVRAVAEGLVQIEQLKRVATETAANVQTRIATALQTAYTAVVGTSTGALKAFRIALASTGIGLVVVALGALIANWDKLTKSIGGSTKAQDDFNKVNAEAQKQIGKTQVELDFYAGVVNDVTKSENERAEALEELNKLGVITDDITLDNVDSLDKLNERLELARENILLKAQAEAAASLLSESIKAQIEAQNTSLDDNISFFETVTNRVLSFGNSWTFASRQVQTGVENQQDAINQAGEDVQRYENLYLELLEKLNENEAKLRKEREQADKNRKDRNKEKQKTLDLDAELNKIQQERIELLKKVRRETELLATSERDEVDVIEEANKTIEKQNKLLEERLGILGTTQGETQDFYDSLTRLIGGVQVGQELTELEDAFNKVFEVIDGGGDTISGIVDDGTMFGKVFGQANTEAKKFATLLEVLGKIDIEYLSEEDRQILIDFFDTQLRINEEAKIYNVELNDTIQSQKDELSVLQGKLSLQLANGEITAEEYTQGVKRLELKRQELDVFEDLYAQEVDYNQLLKEIVDIQDFAVQNGLSTLSTQEEITSLVANRLFDVDDLNGLEKEQLALVEKITKALLEQSKTYEQVRDINEELAKLNKTISDNVDEQNKKLSDAQFQQLALFIAANKERLDIIKEFFRTATTETTNLTQEQIDAIQRLLNSLEFQGIKEEIADITNEIVAVFNDITGQIQGIISDSISLQLEQLEYYGEQSLAEVGDETERQRALQEEIRKDIEKERFELNKRGRISELRFAQAQAIANGAQAIVNALANVAAPFGQILAGIYAGITTAQVTVIRDQLSFVQGTQFQGRRGGLVMGASHEMGGVPMGGGLELEGGEAIINRNAVAQFSDLLSQINISTGGRVIQSNDSEIAQEIRKQNQTPIKTYVLYNDIQNTNKINSKLEQISRL